MPVVDLMLGLVTSAHAHKAGSETDPNGLWRVVIALPGRRKSDVPARLETILPYYGTFDFVPSATISQSRLSPDQFF